ncbi:hypothetical protein V1281_003472 [Nitrobacteraceae bacterium AZCC 2161]
MSDLADLFPGYASEWIHTCAGRIFARAGGKGPPLRPMSRAGRSIPGISLRGGCGRYGGCAERFFHGAVEVEDGDGDNPASFYVR